MCKLSCRITRTLVKGIQVGLRLRSNEISQVDEIFPQNSTPNFLRTVLPISVCTCRLAFHAPTQTGRESTLSLGQTNRRAAAFPQCLLRQAIQGSECISVFRWASRVAGCLPTSTGRSCSQMAFMSCCLLDRCGGGYEGVVQRFDAIWSSSMFLTSTSPWIVHLFHLLAATSMAGSWRVSWIRIQVAGKFVAPATAHVIVFHGADNQTTTRTKMTRTPWKTYIPHIPHHPSTLTLCTEFAERTSRTLKVDSLNIMELFPLEDMTCVVHKFIGTVMDLSWTLPRQRWVYDAKQVLLPIFQGACKTTTIL